MCRIALMLFCFLLCSISQRVSGQEFRDSLQIWYREMSVPARESDSVIYKIARFTGGRKDSVFAFKVIEALERLAGPGDYYFKASLNKLKAVKILLFRARFASPEVSALFNESLFEAYARKDEVQAADISWFYGEHAFINGAIEPAALFCLNGAEILAKNSKKLRAQQNLLLGGILYVTKDYEKSIYYNKLGDSGTNVSTINTIALCFQRLGNFDSAFYHYNRGLEVAKKTNDTNWTAIISGNLGQIYYSQGKYDTAAPLLELDYRTSLKNDDFPNAANSLQWLAKINLAIGKPDTALKQVKRALQLIKYGYTQKNYQQNIYSTAADVYRILNNSDSFYYYSDLYLKLHDSLELSIANSRLEISTIKLENQANIFRIGSIIEEKERKLAQRNYLIAAIAMLSVIAVLLLNSKRLKVQQKEQLTMHQKNVADLEIASATEQLKLFTQNLIDKNIIIESLQQELQVKDMRKDQQLLAETLMQQTILTQEDWDKFRALFQKIHPGFFTAIKESFPDITTAELRMAALIRLHLSTRQMASMLGISLDSVNKTRQRLRSRLQLSLEINMEEYLTRF